MTAIVRISMYASLITAPVAGSSGRLSTDSVGLLKQPRLGGEKLTVSNTSVPSLSATAASGTQLALVQVQPGKVVHYEVTPQPDADILPATDTCPTIEGSTIVNFGPGWRISFLENTDS